MGQHLSTRTKGAVTGAGPAFGSSREFAAVAEGLGLDTWATYVAGRGGVLGPVPAAVVTAAFGFFGDHHVEDAWRRASDRWPVQEVAARDARAMASWGQRVFADCSEASVIATLGARVVAAADTRALPLFAAWRALPDPSADPAARAALTLMRLREHRGGIHLLAVRSVGLTAARAVAASGGQEKADANGWRDPIEVRTGDLAALERAERLTDERAEEAFLVLDDRSRAAFAAAADAVLGAWTGATQRGPTRQVPRAG